MMLVDIIFTACLVITCVHGHAFMSTPESRVVLAWGARNPRLCSDTNCNYEPQSVSSAMGEAPNGVCGDPRQEVNGLWWTAGGGRTAGTYTQGGTMTVTINFTAFHMGRSTAKICRFAANADQKSALTTDCLNQYQLVQAANGAQPGLSEWYHGTGTAALTPTTVFQLPPGLNCDGVNFKCVLQWRYQTGNSCTPQGTPAAYAKAGLSTCANQNSMEQFWQCADIVINPSGSNPPPSNPSPAVTQPPTNPSPAVTQPPAASPKVATPPTASPAITSGCGSNPACFCNGKAAGMYADTAVQCANYFWCTPTGTFYMPCSIGLRFNNAKQQCDWPANTPC